MSNETPQVYIACLAAYNAGRLHGEWADATDAEEMEQVARRVLATSPAAHAEEIAIHDYEDLDLGLGEYPTFSEVEGWARLVEQHGLSVVRAAKDHGADTPDAAETCIDEACRGTWDTISDFVDDFLEDFYSDVPDLVRGWIDNDRVWRDLEHDFWACHTPSGVVIFDRHWEA